MFDGNYDYVSGRMYAPLEGALPNPIPPVEYLLVRLKEKDVQETQLLTFYALKALYEEGESAWRIEKLFRSRDHYSKFLHCLTRAQKIFEFQKMCGYLPLPNGDDQIMLGQLLSYDSADQCPSLHSIYKLVLKLGEEA